MRSRSPKRSRDDANFDPFDFTMMLSVIIPTYNEAKTIVQVIDAIHSLDVGMETEIIVVNDGSTDETAEILEANSRQKKNVKVFTHAENLGKGKALKTGLSHCTGTFVIIQDADLEYSPADYPQLLEPLVSGKASVVYGSRFIDKTISHMPLGHSIGNRLLTFLSNLLNGCRLTDMETGYKAFRREVASGFTLNSNRFSIEAEITAKIARRKFQIHEVPIHYRSRTYAEGKKLSWKDGVLTVFPIFWYRFFD